MKEKESQHNLIDLLIIFFKWKKTIIGLSLLAAVVSAVVSLMMKEQFRSTAVFFPAKANSVSFRELASGHDNLLLFGEEEAAEQLLQVLSSSDLRNRIVERFNLVEHYDIDTTSPIWGTLLQMEYESKVSHKRNRYGAIEVSVLDTDPVKAADMANEITEIMDTLKNQMQHERAKEGLAIMKAGYLETERNIRSAEDSLKVLRKLGALSTEGHSAYSAMHASAIKEGKSKQSEQLDKVLEASNQYSPTMLSLEEKIQNEQERLALMKQKYDQAQSDSESFLSQKFISERAWPADRKAKPIRWLIVAVSTLATFIFSLFLAVSMESLKNYRSKFK